MILYNIEKRLGHSKLTEMVLGRSIECDVRLGESILNSQILYDTMIYMGESLLCELAVKPYVKHVCVPINCHVDYAAASIL